MWSVVYKNNEENNYGILKEKNVAGRNCTCASVSRQRAAVPHPDSPLKDKMPILHPGQDALLDRCSGRSRPCPPRQSRS